MEIVCLNEHYACPNCCVTEDVETAVPTWMTFDDLIAYANKVIGKCDSFFDSFATLFAIDDERLCEVSVHHVPTALIPADAGYVYTSSKRGVLMVIALSNDERRFVCYQRLFTSNKWDLSICSAHGNEKHLARPFKALCEMYGGKGPQW